MSFTARYHGTCGSCGVHMARDCERRHDPELPKETT